MVHVIPFEGLCYTQDDYNAVTAPPYDVINPDAQQALYDRHPHNIVRLILGQKTPDDTDANNVYTRARQTLESWVEAGAMDWEAEPALYAYTQSWQDNGQWVERRGFIGALQLAPYENGQVLPHEHTLGGPKADRLNLFKATGAILSPIFCLYQDETFTVEKALFDQAPPVEPIEVTDADGTVHRFWPVMDLDTVHRIQMTLTPKTALIADGHHRFETALAYQAWRREVSGQEHAPAGSLPWDYTLAFFTNMVDTGLRVYPTHRVLARLPQDWTAEKLLNALSDYFEPVDSSADALFLVQQGQQSKKGYRLKAGVDVSMIPEPLQELDVALLDQFVFKTILNQPADALKQQGYLQFIRNDDEITALQVAEPNTLVFWVGAPDVGMVHTICESGYRMPQKSTYFYPKLLSGLVLYAYGPEGGAFKHAPHAAAIKTLEATPKF